jgi:hypothetical protein
MAGGRGQHKDVPDGVVVPQPLSQVEDDADRIERTTYAEEVSVVLVTALARGFKTRSAAHP